MSTLNDFSRSNFWGLLAFGFSYPDNNQFLMIRNGDFRNDIKECLVDCLDEEHEGIEALTKGLDYQEGTLGDFEAEYLSTLHMNTPNPSASLFESHYLQGRDKPSILLELKAFLKNFDLQMAEGSVELEDSLTSELEMMHYLSAKETQAKLEGENDQPYSLAQRDFLKRHLAIWIPHFRKDIEEKSTLDYFRSLARITESFVEYETARLRKKFDEEALVPS